MVSLSAILAVAAAAVAMAAPTSAGLTRSMIRRGQGTATIALMPGGVEDRRSEPSCPDELPGLTRFRDQVNAGANVEVRCPPSPSSPTPPRPHAPTPPRPTHAPSQFSTQACVCFWAF